VFLQLSRIPAHSRGRTLGVGRGWAPDLCSRRLRAASLGFGAGGSPTAHRARVRPFGASGSGSGQSL